VFPVATLESSARQLDPLRFPAGQRGRRLPEPHVPEPDVVQRLDPAADLRDVGEELERLLDRHLEHVGDRLALKRTSSVSRL